MIVFTRVSLILLVPLLVQGTSPTLHSNGSGNLDDSNWSSKEFPNIYRRLPGVENHHQLRPLALASNRPIVQGPSLQTVDEHYKALILSPVSQYGMLRSSIRLPIPADGYYRVPPEVVVGLPGRIYRYFTRYQVVRSRMATIQSCIATFPSHATEIPMLRIDLFIHGIRPSTENDYYLQVWLFPPESKYHGRTDPTNELPIESDKYIQLPPKVVVTTPIGTFTSASGHVVRTIPHIAMRTFQSFKDLCQASYVSQVHQEVSDIDRSVYVEDCISKNVRSRSGDSQHNLSLPRIEHSGKKRKSPPPNK